jgi:ABC-type lipoprotein release transport system permease subunit
MGAESRLIRRIFILEGWLISLTGLAGGIVAGVILALVQQHFGIIKMPGQYLVQAYPVILSWSDIVITIAGVAAIGYIIALLPVISRRQAAKE